MSRGFLVGGSGLLKEWTELAPVWLVPTFAMTGSHRKCDKQNEATLVLTFDKKNKIL